MTPNTVPRTATGESSAGQRARSDAVSGRRQRRVRTLGLWAIVVLVLSAASALPASASSGSAGRAGEAGQAGQAKQLPGDAAALDQIDAEMRARMEAQAPLSATASRIQEVVDGGHDAGYAGIGLEAEHVVVWWKGAPPAAVRQAIREARRSVPVRIVRAAHSRAELESAAQGVADYIAANRHLGYNAVEIAYDGSGLVVNRDPSSARRSAATTIPSGMDVPSDVAVQVQDKAPLELTGRLDDFAPYWGGGRINNNDNTGSCTAGWPVRQGSTEYMLTAGHCGRPGGDWNNGNDTRFFGTGEQEHAAHDLLLIRADVAPRMWDGGVGSGEFTKHVAGSSQTFPGEVLCASGSVSGVQCGNTVTNTFTFSLTGFDVYGNLETYSDLVLADYCCGTASRDGDSGGPVFSLSGPDVLAEGTITGYAADGAQLVFQDFVTAENDFGIGIAN